MPRVRFKHRTYIRSTLGETLSANQIIGEIHENVVLELQGPVNGLTNRENQYKESNQWYTDKEGRYYWAGATEVVSNFLDRVDSSIVIDEKGANSFLDLVTQINKGILPEWIASKGEGIGIAVIDSGFSIEDVKFNKVNIAKKILINNEFEPKNGIRTGSHGSKCLEMLAISSIPDNELYSPAFASLAKYFLISIQNLLSPQSFLSALAEVRNLNPKPKIVSCSVHCNFDKIDYDNFIELLRDQIDDEIIYFFAMKNLPLSEKMDSFPQAIDHSNVFRVGLMLSEDQTLWPKVEIVKNLIFLPLRNSVESQKFIPSENSFLTPLVAGLFASYLSFCLRDFKMIYNKKAALGFFQEFVSLPNIFFSKKVSIPNPWIFDVLHFSQT